MACRIEIVTHCWRYWRCLTLQISSLILDPPETTRVLLSVCYCPRDKDTTNRLTEIMEWSELNGLPSTVEIRLVPLERPYLCRRSIGRNMLALKTEADWVWFTDCDMTFSGESLDLLGEILVRLEKNKPKAKMCYPGWVMVPSQEAGDEIIFGVSDEWSGPISLDASGFVKWKYAAAIGGVQIVRKDVCLEHGYLNDFPKLRRPAWEWKRTYEDPTFRRSVIKSKGFRIKGIWGKVFNDGICRIRHTQRGRLHRGLEM